MMVAGETRLIGSRRSKQRGSVIPAVNLSGKRAAAGQNSEKLIEAPKEQYFQMKPGRRLWIIESLRLKNRER